MRPELAWRLLAVTQTNGELKVDLDLVKNEAGSMAETGFGTVSTIKWKQTTGEGKAAELVFKKVRLPGQNGQEEVGSRKERINGHFS